jgi:hypothetical protein
MNPVMSVARAELPPTWADLSRGLAEIRLKRLVLAFRRGMAPALAAASSSECEFKKGDCIMKKYLIPAVVMTFSSLISVSQSAWANGELINLPELVKVSSEEIFAPPGFDDNDNAQIVVHGELLNTCFKAAPPLVNVDAANHLITVTPQAYSYSGCWCLDVLVPFTQTVDLGLLRAGQYKVMEMNAQGKRVHDVLLPVEVARSASPDDALYAPVKQAKVELGAPGTQNTLVLSGSFSSDCMEMQEVKTFHRTANIVEVLPIAAYKAGTSCTPNPKPFEVRVKLPAVAPGNTLLYVRSLNGQAVTDVELF